MIATDPSDERRDLAVSLGIRRSPRTACPACRPGRAAAARAVRLTALAGALDPVPRGHRARRAPGTAGQPVELPLGGAFHRRRLTIRSSQVSTIPAALAGRWDVAAAAGSPSTCSASCRCPRWPRPSSRSGRRRRPTRRWTAGTGCLPRRAALSMAPCTRRGQRCGCGPSTSCRHAASRGRAALARLPARRRRPPGRPRRARHGRGPRPAGRALRDAAARVDGADLETVVPAEAVTVEVFARWVHELAAALGPARAVTLAVRVWESPVAFGGYTSDL